jgi:hypothetical protein
MSGPACHRIEHRMGRTDGDRRWIAGIEMAAVQSNCIKFYKWWGATWMSFTDPEQDASQREICRPCPTR